MQVIIRPYYAVEGYEGARGAHLYRIRRTLGPEAGSIEVEGLPSVTKKLDLIGGDKTGALMGWATKTALAHVREHLNRAHEQGLAVTPELIEATVAEGRKRPTRVKDEAADLGTRVHALIDRWIAGERGFSMREDESVAFDNFLLFVKAKKLQFVSGDMAVASRKYRYGGRLDAIAVMGKKIILMDWKTSNAIRNDYALQVAGYRQALDETCGMRADGAMVVRFDKVDPNVLDYREVALAQATRTWKALVAFGEQYEKEVWK